METRMVAGMRIPVGTDGFVPEAALQKRFKTVYDKKQHDYDSERAINQMNGEKTSMPNINLARRDYMNSSDKVIPLRCTPEQAAAWWQDPTKMDIEDIDAPGAPKVNVPRNMTPQQKRDQGHIRVVSTPGEEQMVRRTLVMTFGNDDVHKIAQGRPTVVVAPEPVGKTGMYYPSRKRMELDRYNGINKETFAHEAGHHLRYTDGSRSDVILKSNPNICIEESCTVAEQMARSDKPDYSGYYMSVAVYDAGKHAWRKPTVYEARRMAEEDHSLFTEGRRTGLKGNDATSSVKRHWSESHISRLRIEGNKMAINIMADKHGNVDRVSMAKTATAKERAPTINNATAGRPGVAANTRQTRLFSKSR